MNYVDVAGKQRSKKKNNNQEKKKQPNNTNYFAMIYFDFGLHVCLHVIYFGHTIHKDITLQCVHRVCTHIDYTA